MLAPRRPLLIVSLLVFAAIATGVHANHFILPCHDDCVSSRWLATGSMNVPRWGHTATLLADGTVLVAGGYRAGIVPLDSAELYDPVTKSWRTTGRMTMPRAQHNATLLRDGRVLVSGSAEGTWARAELYDPASGTWSETGSMVEQRSGSAAALLADGRVLVAGGWRGGDASAILKSAEVYDPATARWTRTGDLATERWGAVLTPLQNGRVLAVMGSDSDDFMTSVATAELFDPLDGTWSPAGSTGFGGVRPTSSLLPDGSVLVVGGYGGMVGGFGSARRYDPQTNAWRFVTDPGDPRYALAAAVLPGGDVLVVGGQTHTGYPARYTTYATVRRFVAATGAWSRETDLRDARSDASLTILRDGTALVAGGVVVSQQGSGEQMVYTTRVVGTAELYLSGSASAVLNVGCTAAECEGMTGLPGPGRGALAIEYYHPELDRYFLSASPADIEALDSHRIDGWARTGGSFPVAMAPEPSRRLIDPVCRFYLPPEAGDSHFFSASAEECAEVAQRFRTFVRETDTAFYVALPDASSGACADTTLRPVYRLWNGRGAANHRYTTVRAVRDRMIARGFVPEGYGPDGVAFCVP